MNGRLDGCSACLIVRLIRFDAEPGDSDNGYVALAVDPTGTLLAVAGANKTIRIVHAHSGTAVGLGPCGCATGTRGEETSLMPPRTRALARAKNRAAPRSVAGAQAEISTSLQFTADGRRLVSVSADGTIAIWRLELSKAAIACTKSGRSGWGSERRGAPLQRTGARQRRA